ncbi:MAG TPA: exosome complex RNA-binding protein Rrp4 [Methanomassiliicoccaceae archaeon]|jgi:exosome complex component RRP4|nr:KH domain-containing protein [Euryarchaeota archaeon]HOB38379.1 exosome complex RNA-binding protein Rrp4 [Methanomassiliicoccaceae archaeon]HOK28292.1 exosome complex RNA-binding protein Rrp4 [Methanomassiliicoccaceae archaeon]HOL08335.1 exosome complex RNA-binding protein Rrp4 [Methanomassiliicoccaceae archaeon]HPP44798.1 exosome complex RNA-binding protein Rrp4 [Methanomassiliicoccaceae archaeon]
MNNDNSRQEREIVMPGDLLDGDKLRPGAGTYVEDGKIYAAILGIKTIKSNYVNIIPMGGRYIPCVGDSVIGKVEDIGPSNWLIDINAPHPAPLHVNEVPWRVEFGDTARYMNVGDVILAKILMVDETMRFQVTMKDQGLRKLQDGQIVEISPSKVPRVIGKSGSMIQMIKGYTNCRIFVGQNGRIWLDGEVDNIMHAIKAIQMIEEDAHSFGLTERVKEYLEGVTQQTSPGSE